MSEPDLPSFVLAQPPVSGVTEVEQLAREVFEFKDFRTWEAGDIAFAQECGTQRIVEYHHSVRMVWFADWDYLWKADQTPTQLPSDADAGQRGLAFLTDHHLLPVGPAALGLGSDPVMVSGTFRTKPGQNQPSLRLDVHVAVPIAVQPVATMPRAPIAGRGGKWSVTYGDGGRLINCIASGIQLGDEGTLSKQLPVSEFLGTLEQRLRGRKLSITLVYERFHDVHGDEWLTPMHLVRVEFPWLSRLFRVPATEKSRALLNQLMDRSAPPPVLPAQDDTITTVRQQGLDGYEGLGGAWGLNADDEDVYSLKDEESEQFVTTMRDQGWNICQFTQRAALEDHWHAKRGDYVEQADFAHFSGHAAATAWFLSPPADDGSLDANEVFSEVRYGTQYLNWIFISACGPLQDHTILNSSFGHPGSRWFRGFAGVYGLCGFASTSLGRIDMGTVLARELASRPATRAWFRACRECQPLLTTNERKDGFAIWAATLTDDNKDLQAYDQMLAGQNRTRVPAKGLLGVWTPV